MVSVFLSGAALYELKRARLPEWDALPPRELRATLHVDRMFSPRPDGKSVSGLGHIIASETVLKELAGQSIYFSLNLKRGTPLPPRSSEIAVIGVLQTLPRDPPSDTFEGYLANAGVNFRLTRAKMLATTAPATAYNRFCDAALRRFDRLLDYGLESHPDLSGVFRAMLLNQQQELSDEQSQIYMESGTFHLFSISGLHIAAIAGAIYGILMLLQLPRWAQVLVGAAALWLYVDITGGSPPAVRSWIMVMFLHGSHRPNPP